MDAKINHLVLICSYAPKGLQPGEPIYEPGKPASNCPKGFAPNKKYKGLCGKERILDPNFKNFLGNYMKCGRDVLIKVAYIFYRKQSNI